MGGHWDNVLRVEKLPFCWRGCERKKALEKRRKRISSMYPRGEDIVNIIPWVVVYLVAYSKGLSSSYLCAKPYYEQMH